jgi:hypothetical protein
LTSSQVSVVVRASLLKNRKPVPLFSGSNEATLPFSASLLAAGRLISSARVCGGFSAPSMLLLYMIATGSTEVA